MTEEPAGISPLQAADPAEAGLATPRFPAWSLADVFLVFLVFIVSLFVCTAAGMGLARFIPLFKGNQPGELVKNPFFLVLAQLVAYVVTFAITRMHITIRSQSDFWEAIQWNWLPAPALLLSGIGMGLALVSQLLIRLLPAPPDLPIEQAFRFPGAPLLLMSFALLAAPIMEEVFFRGLLFPALLAKMPLAPAIIITSLLFALTHSSQLAHAWGPLLVLFAVGVVLTLVRYRYRSLAASWMVHFSYNGALFLVALIATHGFRAGFD